MYAELEQRVCPQCKVPKPISEFGRDATNKSGFSCWCKICKKTWRANKRKAEPEKYKQIDFANDLKKHYGITVQQYEKMYEDQKGCCACCGKHEENFKRGLHVDHDHTTGQVRGLLCTKCNPGIGYFDDSIDRLEMAITYLKKFKK